MNKVFVDNTKTIANALFAKVKQQQNVKKSVGARLLKVKSVLIVAK